MDSFYTPCNEVSGGILDSPCLSVRLSVCLSTVLDGFFLYLAQMISIVRGCVACYVFFKTWKFEFLSIFLNLGLEVEKKSTVLD